jgi:predicted ATPase/DNA-binding winged helix-turn-helix (wHTH) protein
MEALLFSSSHFRFGCHEIDASTRTLTRRGQLVEVEPRVLDLLLHLIEYHHRVVSTEELLHAVWGDVEVTASSVSQAVYKARLAIGDDGVIQRSIATVRRRGYRFVAPLLAAPVPSESGGESDFVGRDVELVSLSRALTRAQGGQGGLVCLAGEPGIGKTRLVRELASRALSKGVEVHLARCADDDAPPAFWPWRQLARQLVRQRTRPELAQLGGHRMVELLRAERDLSRGARPGHAAARFTAETRTRLFSIAATGLGQLARERPLLLVLDDIHRADVASLRFLRFLAYALPELPILIVSTFRDDELAAQEAKARLVAEAERAANGETLTLGALSRDETQRLAEKRFGGRVEGPLLDALGELSGGNPFLLGELVHLADGRGDSAIGADRPGALELPRAVRAAVELQLGRLGAQQRRILTMAAVLGVEFDLAPLARAVGIAPDRVARSLLEAVKVHVVAPVAGKTHAFRFVHALVREALYGNLDAREQARHHLRAALALEASSRSGPALLAHHFCEAAAVGGAERGVETALQAARLSVSRLDFERASRELQQALRCLDFVPGASATRRCQILIEAAEVANRSDPRRGALLLGESTRLARSLGEAATGMLGAIAAAAAQLDVDPARLG